MLIFIEQGVLIHDDPRGILSRIDCCVSRGCMRLLDQCTFGLHNDPVLINSMFHFLDILSFAYLVWI